MSAHLSQGMQLNFNRISEAIKDLPDERLERLAAQINTTIDDYAVPMAFVENAGTVIEIVLFFAEKNALRAVAAESLEALEVEQAFKAIGVVVNTSPLTEIQEETISTYEAFELMLDFAKTEMIARQSGWIGPFTYNGEETFGVDYDGRDDNNIQRPLPRDWQGNLISPEQETVAERVARLVEEGQSPNIIWG